jgi:FAD/FMN-containing dehydrogenase
VPPSTRTDALLDALRDAVGEPHVLVDPDVTASYRTDWTGRWTGGCLAVVRPADTAETVAVVRLCASSGASMVPQGGNTGLVGGAVPTEGQVVLSTRRLDQLSEVDDLTGQITAGAGVTIATVQQAAERAGWQYPVDFGARDTATVGGTIATNAGGHHVIRHGMTRRHVLGIEAVLADGTVVSHLGGLLKDNTGVDLAGLLCGSEGTLGVVTAARLALVPRLDARAVAHLGFPDLEEAVAAIGPLRRNLAGLEAVEVMFTDGLRLVAGSLGAAPPVDAPVVVLVEVADRDDPSLRVAEALEGVVSTDAAVVATDPRQRAELWRWRDAHTESINRVGPNPPHKLDVTVPLAVLPRFVRDIRDLVPSVAPGAQLWLFGHLGDGNLHVNVTGPDPGDDAVDDAVLRLVARLGGSISAEHGIGRAKRRWLHLGRSPEEISAFRAIARALDPAGVMNPGVLLPDDADDSPPR